MTSASSAHEENQMTVDRVAVPERTSATCFAGAHVVVSELAVEIDGVAALETAFQNRLGEVDGFPGHLALQVWKDDRHPGRYLMVTWWESEIAFKEYMRSDSHRRSHDRIPSDPVRARPVHVDRYTLVAT
jgi:heme-degrading monooxygenase HmoA